MKVFNSYIEHRYFGQVLQHLPLSSDVVDRADNDNVLQLVVVKIGRSQRHHQVT